MPAFHSANFSELSTCTRPTIWLWPWPQYWSQKMWCVSCPASLLPLLVNLGLYHAAV